MPLHIGIVACSAEGAALCYRTICVEGVELFGPYGHPEVSMHGHNFADYVKRINAGDWVGVAELMLSSAEKLAKAGADFLIAPVNTVHQAFDLVEHRSPRPWLHIAVEVANEARRHGYKRLGILGTRALMEGPVYREQLKAFGIEHRVPDAAQRERIHSAIFDELVHGVFLPRTQAYLTEVIRSLKDDGCDAVVLGCTEIPLLMTQEQSPLPMLDSTRILARAALKKAAEGSKKRCGRATLGCSVWRGRPRPRNLSTSGQHHPSDILIKMVSPDKQPNPNRLTLRFRQLPGLYAVVRQPPDAPIPAWAGKGDFTSVSRTAEELSIVCPAENLPKEIVPALRWTCLKLEGPFDFSLTGVLLSFIQPLSVNGVPIFTISTFDTDYVLIPQEHVAGAMELLRQAGHEFISA